MTPYYWMYYTPYYYYPPFTFQPMFFLYDIYSLMLTTYYWRLYIEAFRLALDTWRKSFETMFRALETTQTQPT